MSKLGGVSIIFRESTGGGSTDGNALLSGVSTISRENSLTGIGINPSGSMRLTYFTSNKSGTFTKLKVMTSSTAAAATPTLCKMAMYSVDSNEDLTRIAVTANDTALFATINTAYTKSTVASFALAEGQRYAFAVLVVSATTLPTLMGLILANSAGLLDEMAITPRITALYSGQTDIVSSVTNASLSVSASVNYAAILP